jgi:hypothetical protein
VGITGLLELRLHEPPICFAPDPGPEGHIGHIGHIASDLAPDLAPDAPDLAQDSVLIKC